MDVWPSPRRTGCRLFSNEIAVVLELLNATVAGGSGQISRRCRRSFRPPRLSLEPQDGALHPRQAEHDSHHRCPRNPQGPPSQPKNLSSRPSPVDATCSSSEPSARRGMPSRKKPGAAECTTSRSAGSAERSPTSAPSAPGSTASKNSKNSLKPGPPAKPRSTPTPRK